MKMYWHKRVVLPAGLLLISLSCLADSSSDIIDKANNPLHLGAAFALQDYYTPDIYGTEQHTNDALMRATIPIAPGDFITVPQIMRVTAPFATRPQPSGGYDTGLGDINLFDVFLLKQDGVKLGIGPLLTANSAQQDELGSGQWQGGVAAVAVYSSPKIMAGTLIQWQKSFAGSDDRAHVESSTFQPVLMYKLPQGWFIRSSAVWTFNLKNGDNYIPVGLGAGRAVKMGNTIVNAFVEPQWTVSHSGDYTPQFTLYTGLSFTFAQ